MERTSNQSTLPAVKPGIGCRNLTTFVSPGFSCNSPSGISLD